MSIHKRALVAAVLHSNALASIDASDEHSAFITDKAVYKVLLISKALQHYANYHHKIHTLAVHQISSVATRT
jgi:hypothetical protein